MTQLRDLKLYNNMVGDKGHEALSGALASGAMASLEQLVVNNEKHPALKAACQARGIDLR